MPKTQGFVLAWCKGLRSVEFTEVLGNGNCLPAITEGCRLYTKKDEFKKEVKSNSDSQNHSLIPSLFKLLTQLSRTSIYGSKTAKPKQQGYG